MSTADFVFIESKDPIFLDLQAFCTALRKNFRCFDQRKD